MAPIYLSPLFCGKDAKLQLKKELIWDDLFLPKDTICIVLEILGYSYVISPINYNKQMSFRVKDSIMYEYFNILDAGVKPWIEEDARIIKKSNTSMIALKKDLVIKDVVILKEGMGFFLIKDITDDGKVFWNLYDGKTYERTLRLRDNELKTMIISNAFKIMCMHQKSKQNRRDAFPRCMSILKFQ